MLAVVPLPEPPNGFASVAGAAPVSEGITWGLASTLLVLILIAKDQTPSDVVSLHLPATEQCYIASNVFEPWKSTLLMPAFCLRGRVHQALQMTILLFVHSLPFATWLAHDSDTYKLSWQILQLCERGKYGTTLTQLVASTAQLGIVST